MKMIPCPNCNMPTGYKRTIGFGTFLALLLTAACWHENAVGTNKFFLAFEGHESLPMAESHAAALGFTKVRDCKYQQYAGRPPITDYTDCKFLKSGGESMEMSFYHGQLQRIEYGFEAAHYSETLETITKANGNSSSPAGADFLVWNRPKQGRISLGKTPDGTRGSASVQFDFPELDQQMKDLAVQAQQHTFVLKPLPISTVDLLKSYDPSPKLTNCWDKNPDGTTQCDYRAKNHDLTLVDANGRLMRASVRFDHPEKPQGRGDEQTIQNQIADFVRKVTGNPAPAPFSKALRDLDTGDAWSLRSSETILNGISLTRWLWHGSRLTIDAVGANENGLAPSVEQESRQNSEKLKAETDTYCVESLHRYGSEVGQGLCDAAIDSMVKKLTGQPSAYDLCMMGADVACDIANDHMSPADPRWDSLQRRRHHY
jgi:hypothetical protein